ncbi:MAG: SdpI family protein [Candidatus Nanoarchaeia archaeon]
MNKINLVSILIILFSIASAFYFYNILPDKIDTHWDSGGQVNGTMGKFYGLFLFPILLIFIYVLFRIIPRIDPLKENIKKFRKQYDLFVLIIVLFVFYTYILTLLWNLGYRFNMLQMIIPGFIVIFYYIGILLKKTKRNYFIGIRTPWTLESDFVWDKTHALGSKLFKITALVSLFLIIFPRYSIFFIIIFVILESLALVIYSYIIFKKSNKNARKNKR